LRVGGAVMKNILGEGDGDEARSISRWSPYDRVRVVNADP
jgi:hypothetical protein